jgi:asparaginyl-tRNA synthetase
MANDQMTAATPIKELLALASAGGVARVNGWIRTRRDSRGFSFLEINDGSCLANLQVVAPDTLANFTAEISRLTTGSSVTVEGTVVDSPGKGQRFELQATSVTVYGFAPPEYPLQKKRHTFEYLREIAHLRPRTNALGAVARLRSSLSFAIHRFFQERGFFYVHTPIITASDCEGAGALFQVTSLDMEKPPRTEQGRVDYTKDFFGKKAGLSVSGQLEGEIYALALGKVYTFGPTFRAEHSNTPRHLAEFWMVEPEMAFYRLTDDMDLAEEMVRFLARDVLERNHDDIALFNDRIDHECIARLEMIAANPFERITYTTAIDILQKNNASFEFPVEWGSDIQSCTTTRNPSRRFTCGRTATERPPLPWTCSCRVSANSSAAANVRSAPKSWYRASGNSASKKKTTGGTSICARPARPRIRDSASGSSACSCSSPACRTSAT